MGCDIHPVLEIRPRGVKCKFTRIGSLVGNRNYDVFRSISGVRGLVGDDEQSWFITQDKLPDDTSIEEDVFEWGHSLTVMPFDKLQDAVNRDKELWNTDVSKWVRTMEVFERLGMEARVIAWYDN